MSKITISMDNTADLSAELYKKYGFERVCMGVVFGDRVVPCCDVKPEDIYKAVEVDGILPKTNGGLEVDYTELFEKATKDGGSIIHFSVSGKLSVSHSNARRAAANFERVYIIDTKTLSTGTAMLAIRAHEMVQEGKDVAEIHEAVTAMVEKLDVSFVLNDLKYIHRGGRASGLKLLGANLLKIRPSLFLDAEGKIVPGKKFKGKFSLAVKEWTQYKMREYWENIDKRLCFLMHTDIDDEIAMEMHKDLKEFGFKEIIRLPLGTTLTTHIGRNMIGVASIKQG